MIRIEDYRLFFQSPDTHEEAEMAVEFRRTLRIPDDGKTHMLPPSHRAFPLKHMDDCGDRVPGEWSKRGGVIMPVHPTEAMWIAFSGGGWVRGYPFAIKIGTGKINAISGKTWKDGLDPSESDYIVVPRQSRLDGYCIAMNAIRQFVAMQLGSGHSIEKQVTGKEETGGLQIVAYPMKRERYESSLRRRSSWVLDLVTFNSFAPQDGGAPYFRRARQLPMSLAAGGRMKQPIYRDPYGIDAWDQSAASRCFVTLADARLWPEIAGEPVPTEPPTAKDYAEVGLPWLDYAASPDAVPGAEPLAAAKSAEEIAAERGDPPLTPVGVVRPDLVISVGAAPSRA